MTVFGGLEIAFDRRVLTPRAWTIAQSRWAAELLPDLAEGPVLELFAGVGHIGLAALASSTRRLVLIDLNPAACELAQRNVEVAGLGDRVEIRQGRVDEVIEADETFPLIIADPPWVPSAGVDAYPEDPHIAIDGGHDGLELARAACGVVHEHLASGGSTILQLGTREQAHALEEHLVRTLNSDVRLLETRTYERGVLMRLSR